MAEGNFRGRHVFVVVEDGKGAGVSGTFGVESVESSLGGDLVTLRAGTGALGEGSGIES